MKRRRAKQGEALHFLRKVVADQPDTCVLWSFGRTTKGYGCVMVSPGVIKTAHRAALAMHTGYDPGRGYAACHAPRVCKSTLCVTPAHLRWATYAENEADKKLK